MECSKRLIDIIANKDWDTLVTILKPKDFCSDMPRTLDDFIKVLKVAELLTDENVNLSENVVNVLLKCLANSCVNGYLEKSYLPQGDNGADKNIYKHISNEVSGWNDEGPYPYQNNFPYDSIVRWIVKKIIEYNEDQKKLTEEENEILRFSLQFLCNYFTFAFNVSTTYDADTITDYIQNPKFKDTIIKLIGHERAPIARAACAYVHNMVKLQFKDFYTTIDKKELTAKLIKSTIADIQASLDTITLLLLNEPCYLKDVYNEITVDDKLYLLDIIHDTICQSSDSDMAMDNFGLQLESIKFLSDIFKKKSDIIFKSVETMNELDVTEINILLDILAKMTARNNSIQAKELQNDTSLMTSCLYLLKGVHLHGKQSNNHFTPLEKLSELTINTQDNCCNEADSTHNCFKKIEAHPSYSFKGRIIRLIANLVHRHRKNQDLVRENDGIPLLLDCCNIDARNPLLTQWVIFAISNLVEGNFENAQIIRDTVRVGGLQNTVSGELRSLIHGTD